VTGPESRVSAAPAAKEATAQHETLFGRFDRRVDGFFEAHLRGRAGADVVMYGASALGEHSFLWLVLAGAKGWRAGTGWAGLARASAVLAAESLLVNGIIKSFFRRQRPQHEGPRPLPLRTPKSSSFPSGHASAAFFSAALLRGSGKGWPLYYLLAALVSASRVHVRIHHASDVLAGAAFGAVLGELARRRVSLAPPCGTSVRARAF
jgi:undecaprenyl-diphosphatase